MQYQMQKGERPRENARGPEGPDPAGALAYRAREGCQGQRKRPRENARRPEALTLQAHQPTEPKRAAKANARTSEKRKPHSSRHSQRGE